MGYWPQYCSLAFPVLWIGSPERAIIISIVFAMTNEELLIAIDETKCKIEQVKQTLENCPDLRQERKAEQRLKELQYLQLWHLDLMQR